MAVMIAKNIHFPKQLLDYLRQISDETGIPIAEHIRRAVDDYLRERNPGRTTHDKGDSEKTC